MWKSCSQRKSTNSSSQKLKDIKNWISRQRQSYIQKYVQLLWQEAKGQIKMPCFSWRRILRCFGPLKHFDTYKETFYISDIQHVASRTFHFVLIYAFLLLDSLRNLFLSKKKNIPPFGMFLFALKSLRKLSDVNYTEVIGTVPSLWCLRKNVNWQVNSLKVFSPRNYYKTPHLYF